MILSTPFLSPKDRHSLQLAINYINQDPWNTSPEITTSTRFLGYPLGSPLYANNYLIKIISNFSTTVTKL
jgi:hypothetical protein